MMAVHTSALADRIEALFASETGYATPKVDVRGAVFDGDDRLLMVREVAGGGLGFGPPGWTASSVSCPWNYDEVGIPRSGLWQSTTFAGPAAGPGPLAGAIVLEKVQSRTTPSCLNVTDRLSAGGSDGVASMAVPASPRPEPTTPT